jgi:beta-N-acetylhexosaminidase
MSCYCQGWMNLDEKIGQLFVVPARGELLDAETVRHVRENRVGGIIWFESTSDAARRMTSDLQGVAKTPLLVSADLESGAGMRFTDRTWWPPAMAIAATGDVALAELQARATAREALAIGVNQILAPVADVNVSPANPVINIRSFGEDAREVARYVSAFVRGIQDEGALATAKHFPGHGDTAIDSHRALPVLEASRERLDQVELLPFRAAIESGVAAIMIGHLAVPAIDSTPVAVRTVFENVYGTAHDEVTRGGTVPATLSRRVIRDLLRGELGFEGLVITDAFDMGGLAAHADPGEAAVRAVEAGNDQVLFSADTDAAIAAVRAAVAAGRIPMQRIDESVERIMHAKRFLARPRSSAPLRDESAGAEEIARRSIALVRDERGLLPLEGHDFTAVVVSDLPEENPLLDTLRMLAPARVVTIDSTTTHDMSVDGDVVLLLALRPKSGAGRIVVPPAARRIAERNPARTIAISFGSPYVSRELPAAGTFLCAWGIQPVLQRAAVRALRGEVAMTGRVVVGS